MVNKGSKSGDDTPAHVDQSEYESRDRQAEVGGTDDEAGAGEPTDEPLEQDAAAIGDDAEDEQLAYDERRSVAVELGDNDPEAIEEEFGVDLDNVNDASLRNQPEQPVLSTEEFQQIREQLGEKHGDGAVRQALNTLGVGEGDAEERKINHERQQLFVKRAMGLSAEVKPSNKRELSDEQKEQLRGDVFSIEEIGDDGPALLPDQDAQSEEEVLEAGRDVIRISQAFAKRHHEENGSFTATREYDNDIREAMVVNSFAKEDSDMHQIETAATVDGLVGEHGDERIERGGRSAAAVQFEVTAEDVAYAPGVFPVGRQDYSRMTFAGGAITADNDDITVFTDETHSFEEHLNAVRNPSEADEGMFTYAHRDVRRAAKQGRANEIYSDPEIQEQLEEAGAPDRLLNASEPTKMADVNPEGAESFVEAADRLAQRADELWGESATGPSSATEVRDAAHRITGLRDEWRSDEIQEGIRERVEETIETYENID